MLLLVFGLKFISAVDTLQESARDLLILPELHWEKNLIALSSKLQFVNMLNQRWCMRTNVRHWGETKTPENVWSVWGPLRSSSAEQSLWFGNLGSIGVQWSSKSLKHSAFHKLKDTMQFCQVNEYFYFCKVWVAYDLRSRSWLTWNKLITRQKWRIC